MQTDLMGTVPDAPLAGVSVADGIARGTLRLLHALGYSGILEFPLSTGRRVDIMALAANGDMIAVEIKSSLADFRSDAKWPEYLPYCDGLYFAVSAGFPTDVLPAAQGLIVADRFDGAIQRGPVAPSRMAGATRRAQLTRFALIAAQRLHRDDIGWVSATD